MDAKSTSEIPSSTEDRAIAIVLTTIGADVDATTIARTLVEERLAACVNVLPAMTSIYSWKGTIEQEREQQLVMKTTVAGVPDLEARLRTLHPYELPEFIVITGTASATYAGWVVAATGE